MVLTFLLALDVFLVLVVSQVAVFVGCAAGFVSSESDRTIVSGASFVSEKSTLAFLVFLFVVLLAPVDISVSDSLFSGGAFWKRG